VPDYGLRVAAFARRTSDAEFQGTSEVVADGAGKLSEGSMSLHSVREENEGIPCKYGLRNGSYTINPDGSGRTDGQWKFMEGGGSGWKCFDLGCRKTVCRSAL